MQRAHTHATRADANTRTHREHGLADEVGAQHRHDDAQHEFGALRVRGACKWVGPHVAPQTAQRTRVHGTVDILNIGDTLQIEEHIAFAIALGTSATIEVDGDEHVLGEQDALQLDDATTFAVLDGEVYVARID